LSCRHGGDFIFYLTARKNCHLRNERRNFKVDRIVRFLGVDEVQPPAVEEVEPKSEEVEPRRHEAHEAVSEIQTPSALSTTQEQAMLFPAAD
jgi:hypothetical protein